MAAEAAIEEWVRRRPPGGRFVGVLIALPAVGFVLFAALRLFGLDGNRHTVAALALTPYVTVAGLLLGVLAALLRRWVTTIVVLVLVAIMTAAVLPRILADAQPTANGQRVRVLSVNLYYGQADAAEVVRLVRQNRVDVLSLQELTPRAVADLDRAGLAEQLPFRVFRALDGAAGSGLAARHPLTERPLTSGSVFAQPAALVDLPGLNDAEVVAVHPVPPVGAGGAATWKRELADLPRPNFAGHVRMLVGDFNATLDHAALRGLLDAGYRDAAERRGDGLTPTWPHGLWPPPVTIDHVLVDERCAVEHYRVFDLPGTDHRPVFAQIVLP